MASQVVASQTVLATIKATTTAAAAAAVGAGSFHFLKLRLCMTT